MVGTSDGQMIGNQGASEETRRARFRPSHLRTSFGGWTIPNKHYPELSEKLSEILPSRVDVAAIHLMAMCEENCTVMLMAEVRVNMSQSNRSSTVS